MSFRLALTILGALPALAASALADGSGAQTIFHSRLGALNPHYWSAEPTLSGSFTSLTSLEVEYEILQNTRSSFVIKAAFVENFAEARVVYTGMGVSKRFYFVTNNGYQEARVGGTAYSYKPLWRFYAGGDLGISTLELKKSSKALGTSSTLLELGPSGGVIYQAGQNVGVEFNLGVSAGYGFTTVSVSALLVRGTLGVAVYF